MLAYTPLHHLLMAEIGAPVVATSGNLQDEPICTENDGEQAAGRILDTFTKTLKRRKQQRKPGGPDECSSIHLLLSSMLQM